MVAEFWLWGIISIQHVQIRRILTSLKIMKFQIFLKSQNERKRDRCELCSIGTQWKCMKIHENLWNYMKILENGDFVRNYPSDAEMMDFGWILAVGGNINSTCSNSKKSDFAEIHVISNFHEKSRKFTNVHGFSWKSLKLYANIWKFMKIHENPWKFMKVPENTCRSWKMETSWGTIH